jgi:hypothetical protein
MLGTSTGLLKLEKLDSSGLIRLNKITINKAKRRSGAKQLRQRGWEGRYPITIGKALMD